MDAARTALRLGADNVEIIYRRTKTEMPARAEEIHHAEEEGVKFRFLTAPVRFLGNTEGRLEGVECIRMELGEPDSTGRPRPVEVKGSEYVVPCDMAIIAVGSGANPVLTSSAPDMKLNRINYIVADPETGRTSKKGVWAGGDIVTGQATVILAMGAGRKAADSIDAYLSGDDRSWPEEK